MTTNLTKYAGGLACVQVYNQFDKQINKLNKSGAQSKSVLLYKGGWVLNKLTIDIRSTLNIQIPYIR